MKPYRTLFVGELVQESSLSVGGNQPSMAVDSPLCRNGKNRFTLRGTSIAGALISTASKIVKEVPTSITNKFKKDRRTQESLWRFFNAHPEGSPIPELRQGVGLVQATGAAAEGVLFDVETLPRGTKWWFCLEVNTAHEKDGALAERIAAAALQEWERGHCWIGRDVARGLGWMKLTHLQAYRLGVEHLYDWPNSLHNKNEDYPRGTVAELAKLEDRAVKPIASERFAQEIGILPSEECKPWSYLEIEGEIIVGERQDEWGIDSLSLGGHAANKPYVEWDARHYLAPQGMNPEEMRKNFGPDFAILVTQCLEAGEGKKDGPSWEPMIPGSSIRGTMRHALSRLLRMRDPDQQIKDPNDPSQESASGESKSEKDKDKDPVENLFGGMDHSASLLVRDAYLSKDKWFAAWVQHHAEDEFCSGVFESSKFDRVALIEGTFSFKMVIEGKDEEVVKKWGRLLEPVFKMGSHGHLSLGGAQWRGSGWPFWKITSHPPYAAGGGTDPNNHQKD